ncbi:MAG: protein kinase [Deltaproteobacteria bacterium]|nr:protein kinase [Deltaproteobacteria bacterium]
MNVCLICGRLYDNDVTHCSFDSEELLPHDPSLENGATVAGHYQVVRAVGLGQTGEIFEGREGESGDRVVLKLLSEDLTKDRRAADVLRRHLFRAKDFKHPGAVGIRAVEQHGERLLLVRDWVEGERLQDVLAVDPAWPVGRAVGLVEQVCTVLAAAHKVALLHLQIRPSNLFLPPPVEGGDERVVVLDFGIGPLRRVGNREVHGTLRTLSPEQIEGRIPTFKSDIYSIGLLLHRLIVGSSAFSGTEEEVARKVASEAPPPLIAPSGEEIPEVLANLVRQMVEKRPIARPPTMAVVLEKLQALRGSIPPASPSHIPPAEAARPTRRERATVVMQALGPRGDAGEPRPSAVRHEPDTGPQPTVGRGQTGRAAAVRRAAFSKPQDDQTGRPAADRTEPTAPAAAPVPAPQPEASSEEGTTQEIQPEIIEDRPRRPPPRIRPRRDDQEPVDAAKMAAAVAAVKATSVPPAAPPAGFGTLPAADGEPPAEQTIDISIEDGGLPKPSFSQRLAPLRDKATALWRKLTPRQRIYVGAAAGAVLLLVVLLLALSGGGGEPSRGGTDATVAAAVLDAATGEATTPAVAAPDAGTTTTDAAETAGDAPVDDTGADLVEVTEPADAASGDAIDDAVGDSVGDTIDDTAGDATDVPREVAADEDAADESADAGMPEGETAASLVAAGNRALNSRQLSRARALFRQALQRDPTNRAARTGMGRAAFQQGQFQEAVRYLEPIYRNQGNMDLGVAYVRVGRRDDARRQFEKLLDRNPNNADARRALDALNR